MSKKDTNEVSESRRKFIKKAAYAAPVVVTLAVAPGMHAYGSVNNGTPTGGGGGGGGGNTGGTL